MIDTITYHQWTAVDSSSLETINQHTYDFVESFCRCTSIPFIYCNTTKRFFNHPWNLVCADFSENHVFVLQDAAQGFHWKNARATLHPFIAYIRESHTSEINHLNFFVISVCLHHDMVAVHLFQKKLIYFSKDKLCLIPTKIIYLFFRCCSFPV